MKLIFTLLIAAFGLFGFSQSQTQVAPYFENFDTNFNPGTGVNNAGSTIDTNWYRDNLPWGTYTEYTWGGGTGQASSQNTGPSSDHTSGSGNYVYAESSAYKENRAKLSTPYIDLDTLSNPQLTFWKHQFGSDIKNFSVQLVVNGFWYGTKYQSVGNKGNQWDKVTIPLNQYVGQTVAFIFVAWRNTDFPGNGLADIAIDDLEVNNAPNCPMPTSQIVDSTALLSLAFDGTGSTGTNLSYDWTFGDGTTATGSSGNHVYAGSGIYNLSLIVTDLCGQKDTLYKQITICDTALSAFSYTQNSTTTIFDGSASSAVAAQYNWNFGDGTTDTGKIVSHIYSNVGSYNVTLTITNLCGDTYSISQLVTTCVKPLSSWSYNIVSSGASGMTIQFSALNSVGATSYYWDFGDGTVNNTSANPSHNYSVAGLFYIVTLIVSNDCGLTDTLTSSLQTIGVEDLILNDFKIYPNPSNGAITLEHSTFSNQEINYSVHDLNGSLIYNTSERANNGVLKMTIEDLSAGVYILRLRTYKGFINKRISLY